jgi:hypothetical protein
MDSRGNNFHKEPRQSSECKWKTNRMTQMHRHELASPMTAIRVLRRLTIDNQQSTSGQVFQQLKEFQKRPADSAQKLILQFVSLRTVTQMTHILANDS